MSFDPSFVPTSEAEMLAALADPHWRIYSGQLYKIMIKSAGGGETVVPFRPNVVQDAFIRDLWYRNVVLKARQRGITTLICIMWLDHALFVPDQRCAIIAQDAETANEIFRDKVAFAYNNLPEALRASVTANTDRAGELLFSNNSSVRVAHTRRGGTTHRLHVSEFGKICARYPLRAKEIQSGAFPSVPLDGITVVESTAEGSTGPFFKMTQDAQQKLTGLHERDWAFKFYPWWDADEYRMAAHVPLSARENEYFDEVEQLIGRKIEPDRRRWYVATLKSDFSGDEQLMWQEYPSTPQEAFKASTDGIWYSKQLALMRAEGRICRVPFVPGVPVNGFWDIGARDGTGIWLHQLVGLNHRFPLYIEGWDQPYSHFVSKLQGLNVTWGTMYLPHDAKQKRQRATRVLSPEDELKELWPGIRFKVVPVVSTVLHGVKLTQTVLAQAYFDEEGCKEGIEHLDGYSKYWDERAKAYRDEPSPESKEHSEAADSLRQWGQEFGSLARVGGSRKKRATIPVAKSNFRG
jgi:hypothetical protein